MEQNMGEKMNDKMMNKKSGLADKVGEAIEKVGTAVSEKAPGLGKKIHDLGDKLETTHKNPNHASDRSN